MTYARDTFETLPILPSWVTSKTHETRANLAFRSGAVLGVLDRLIREPVHDVPLPLLANTLALRAAEATSKLEGRMGRVADIRDAFHLTPDGQTCGPDGDGLAFWRKAAGVRLTQKMIERTLAEVLGADISDVKVWMETGADIAKRDGVLAGCASSLQQVLAWNDRAERGTCLISDVVLARYLGWPTPLPFTALRLTKTMLRDLVAGEENAQLVVQCQLLNTLEDAIGAARKLAERARALRAVAPKLRAKGADAAVQVFLTEDAVAPSSMLSPFIRGTTLPMTARAARRFCDRLVELGVVRELTGRATFRLYGIGG